MREEGSAVLEGSTFRHIYINFAGTVSLLKKRGKTWFLEQLLRSYISSFVNLRTCAIDFDQFQGSPFTLFLPPSCSQDKRVQMVFLILTRGPGSLLKTSFSVRHVSRLKSIREFFFRSYVESHQDFSLVYIPGVLRGFVSTSRRRRRRGELVEAALRGLALTT